MIKNQKRKGAALVETAVFLPILVIVFLATVEICNQIYFKQSIAVSAYEGARVVLMPNASVTDIEIQVKEIAAIRNLPEPTVTVTPSDFSSKPPGTLVSVTVECPNQQSVVGIGLFQNSTLASKTVTIMKER